MEQVEDILALAHYLDEDEWSEEVEHEAHKDTRASEYKLAQLFGLLQEPVKIEEVKRVVEYYPGLERSQWMASWDYPEHKGWYEVQRNVKYDTISRLYYNGQFWFYREVDSFYDEKKIIHLDGMARWRGLAQPFVE